jgi:hypothetical protein
VLTSHMVTCERTPQINAPRCQMRYKCENYVSSGMYRLLSISSLPLVRFVNRPERFSLRDDDQDVVVQEKGDGICSNSTRKIMETKA